MKMKTDQLIKTVLYLLAGIAVLVLNNVIMEAHYVGVIVGLVMFFYAVDIILICIAEKKMLHKDGFFMALMHVLLAVGMFIVVKDLEKVCIIWAVWSILREGGEISECVHRLYHKRPALISLAESVVIIVFSFMMMTDPTEHHAHFHVILLGIELILEVTFPILNGILDDIIDKRAAAKAASASGETTVNEPLKQEDPVETPNKEPETEI